MSMFDDDLTEADLEFLQRFNKMGISDTADSEYNPDEIPEPHPDAEASEHGDMDVEVTEGDGDSDAEADLPDGEGNESGESDSIDESKMDISEVETEPQESKSGKDSSDEAEEMDHLEGGDSDSEIPEGEDELPFEHDPDHGEDDSKTDDDDDFDEREEDAQTEEDDGEGERANSDEARESDEPIKSGDDDSDDEADELSEDHEEPEDEVDEENVRDKMDEVDPDFAKDDQDDPEHEQEVNAEGESDFEGDAQQELEAHLENESDPENDSETEDNSEQDEDTPSDDEAESEPEEEPEQQQQGGSGEGGSDFSDLPGADDNCSDHCEDNESEDGEHECPRCAERIMRERKLWGAIATDMHGNDVLPGDKLRVEIPMSFFVQGQILTANVPNAEMERFAEKTDGTIDKGALWLSGRNISQFTGYHMHGSEIPIWTFTQGRKLRFAEKIGEPEREGGGQGDIEDMIDQLNDDLDMGKFDQGKDEEDEENDGNQNDLDESDDNQNEDEGGQRGQLTGTQMKRFENLFERIGKKAAQTFGSTAEVVEEGEITVTEEGRVARPITIKSRGVQYTLVLVAARDQGE